MDTHLCTVTTSAKGYLKPVWDLKLFDMETPSGSLKKDTKVDSNARCNIDNVTIQTKQLMKIMMYLK